MSDLSLEDINSKVDGLGTAWEAFKKKNDERLTEVEKKGSADPLHKETLDKITVDLDKLQGELKDVKKAASRTPKPGDAKGDNEQAWPEELRAATVDYLRKGREDGLEAVMKGLSPEQQKKLSVGVESDGGFLVTPATLSRIITKVFESSPLRQLASVETITSDYLDFNTDTDEASAGWSDGETAVVAETGTPSIGKGSIAVHEMYAQPKATQKLLDDASVNIESWLANKVAERFTRLEATAFITGDGAGQPKGILSYADGAAINQIAQITSGASGAITADDVIKLVYQLKAEYARNAQFLMKRSSVQAVRLLKDGNDQYLWSPGLAAGQPDTLLGYGIEQADDMPAIVADSLSVAFGDFRSGYQIVDRQGIRTLRDPFTEKPFVKFYTTRRVGGGVVNGDAIKLLKTAA